VPALLRSYAQGMRGEDFAVVMRFREVRPWFWCVDGRIGTKAVQKLSNPKAVGADLALQSGRRSNQLLAGFLLPDRACPWPPT
jgi:hypothetical protein